MTELSDNKNMIVSSHTNGKVIRYKKEDNYKPDLFIETENPIYRLMVSQNTDHIIVRSEIDRKY